MELHETTLRRHMSYEMSDCGQATAKFFFFEPMLLVSRLGNLATTELTTLHIRVHFKADMSYCTCSGCLHTTSDSKHIICRSPTSGTFDNRLYLGIMVVFDSALCMPSALLTFHRVYYQQLGTLPVIIIRELTTTQKRMDGQGQ